MEDTMSIFAKLRQAHQKRQAIRQLRELDPYVLRDIGIEPGQIEEAVSGTLAARNLPQAASPLRQVPKPAPDAVLYKASAFAKGEWPYSHRRAA
jgi:uncharacterized protein YjiS (DUF1127 family)